jgi:hypothetical protein
MVLFLFFPTGIVIKLYAIKSPIKLPIYEILKFLQKKILRYFHVQYRKLHGSFQMRFLRNELLRPRMNFDQIAPRS